MTREGLEVLRIISEPGGLSGYGLDKKGQKIAVYDLGRHLRYLPFWKSATASSSESDQWRYSPGRRLG